MKNILSISLILFSSILFAQYAPAAGQTGSTAIFKDSSIIVSWATTYNNYTIGSDVDSTWQNPEKALGMAEGTSGDIVCLGRGGQITLGFDTLIVNREGADFVTFENGFYDNFLELAYIEVSFDGIYFERFPNYSNTQSSVAAFGEIDPTKINGYCSKYRQGYGTAFDLDNVSLDTIKYVRIVDIVGDGTYFDSNNHPIYDPFPTTGSAGVDLDAVGVINAGTKLVSINSIVTENNILVYPNPAKHHINIKVNSQVSISNACIVDVSGRMVKQIHNINSDNTIDVSLLQTGVYFIKLQSANNTIIKRLIIE